jgi:hypothetical protein
MEADDSTNKLGLDLGGGIETAMSERTSLHAEIWYGLVSDFNGSICGWASHGLGQ